MTAIIMRCVFVAGVGVLVLGEVAQPPTPEKLEESAYLPFKVGTEWTYRAGAKAVVLRVAKIEPVNKVPCAVLETTREGLAITEHVTVKPDGAYRVKALSFEVDPPICFLKWPPAKEKSWTATARIGGEDFRGVFTQEEAKVTVPRGEFAALVVKCTVDRKGDKLEITTYYAKGVGMVKQVQKVGNQEIVMELEKFEEGK